MTRKRGPTLLIAFPGTLGLRWSVAGPTPASAAPGGHDKGNHYGLTIVDETPTVPRNLADDPYGAAAAVANNNPDGTTPIVRHITTGTRAGGGVASGDSGGPVFTVRSAGKIVAKGIVSGAAYVKVFGISLSSTNYFTDIDDACYGLPGFLVTG